MRTTLVTGGAGFIGSNFVERFLDRFPDERVVVLDAFTYAANPANIPERLRSDVRFKLVVGDIRDHAVVDPIVAEVERVVHFAAESHVTRSICDDRPFFETDVMGTHTIMAAVSRNVGSIERVVHISTSEVYGTAEQVPMTEDHPLNPCTPYAAAKAGADRLVYAYQKTYRIPMVIVRPFNNYGPRQHLEKVVPRFITSALLGEPLTVHGDGKMTRDWVHVSDTCEAVLRAMSSKEALGKVVNVGTGTDTSVADIAEMILDYLDLPRSLVKRVEERPGQVDRHIASTFNAWQLLGGFEARVPLGVGLRETVDWYRSNRSWWEGKRGAAEICIEDERRQLRGSF